MATRQEFIDSLIKAGASDDEIVEAVKIAQGRGVISQSAAATPQDAAGDAKPTGLAAGLSERLDRVKQAVAQPEGNLYNEGAGAVKKAIQAPLNFGFIGAGEATGAVGDVVGAGIGAAARGLSKLIPQGVKEKTGEIAKAAVSPFAGLAAPIRDMQAKQGFFAPGKLPKMEPEEKRAVGYAADILTSIPVGMGTKKALGWAGEGIKKKMASQLDTKVDDSIRKAVSKGIKPTVIGKPTIGKLDDFYDNAAKAVRIISKNKNAINLVDEAGEAIARPRNTREFAEAIDQTKKIIYKQYHEMAEQAGEAGARFDIKPIANELKKIADPTNPKMQGFPKTRAYAASLSEEIAELNGAAPDVVEAKIKELNGNLKSFFAGRTDKIQAQVDASVAVRLREQLDKQITEAVGAGYQPLKKEYGALKAIENEVAKRALVNARKSTKGLIDFTDIITGADLAAGILTMNPALIAKGAAGKGIQTAIKSAMDPERTIDKMFKAAYDEVDRLGIKPFTAPVAKSVNYDAPAFARKGVPIEKIVRGEQAQLSAQEAAELAETMALKANKAIGQEDIQNAIRGLRPKGKIEDPAIEAMRNYQAGKQPSKIFGSLGNERGAVGGVALSKDIPIDKYPDLEAFKKDYEILYHGGSKNIIGDKLVTGGRIVGEVTPENLGKGQDYGGIFFTPEREFAETFKNHASGGEGAVHSVLVNKSKLFDPENNAMHRGKLRNFIGKTYRNNDGENVVFTEQMYDFIFPRLDDNKRHMDWATFDPDIISAMGFDGAKIIENYGDGGAPLMSTVLFRGGKNSPHWVVETDNIDKLYKQIKSGGNVERGSSAIPMLGLTGLGAGGALTAGMAIEGKMKKKEGDAGRQKKLAESLRNILGR